jgi:hypothetical protein
MDNLVTSLVRATHTARAVPFHFQQKAEVLQTTRERGFHGNVTTFLGGVTTPAWKEDMTDPSCVVRTFLFGK